MLKKSGVTSRLLHHGINVVFSPFSLIFMAAFIAVFFSRYNFFSESGDRFLFALSAPLIKTETAKKNFVIVRIPQEKLDSIGSSDSSFTEFPALLNALKAAGAVSTVLFSQPLIEQDDKKLHTMAETITAMINESDVSEETISHLKTLLTITEHFIASGRSLNTVMTETGTIKAVSISHSGRVGSISPYAFGDKTAAVFVRDRWRRLSAYLPESARFPGIPEILQSDPVTLLNYPIAPVHSDQNRLNTNAAWKQAEYFIPDITLVLCEKIKACDAEFSEKKGIRLGDLFVKTSNDFFFIPHFRPGTGSYIKPDTYDYAYILSGKNSHALHLNDKVVLIAGSHDKTADAIAQTCTSILNKATSHIPGYAFLLEKGLIIFFLFYLVLIMPRLKPGLSVLMTVLLLLLPLTFHVGAHIIKSLWFPVFTPLLFLVAGHFFLAVSLARRNTLAGLSAKANAAFNELGEHFLESNQFDQAFSALSQCQPDKTTLELLYKTGAALERKRQYSKARDVFTYIRKIKPGYRDTSQRAENLSGILFGRTAKISATGMLSPVEAESEILHSVLGRYEIEREIGKGAMGIVYHAKDPKIGREVAIKTLDLTKSFDGEFEPLKERFLKEARAAGRLNHPNIVTIYDYGEEQNIAFITMDYISGNTLSTYTATDHLLPVAEVYSIVAQVADALDYAHSQGIVHRDVKPGNIIYNPKTRGIKVTDFGIARIADTKSTKTGIILGTPSYMAPEQFKGSRVDGRTDVFSLGVTLYQLLTGSLPFRGDDLASLAYQITSEKHEPITKLRPDLPESAARITNKALNKKPDKRYQTAGSLARILKKEITEG